MLEFLLSIISIKSFVILNGAVSNPAFPGEVDKANPKSI